MTAKNRLWTAALALSLSAPALAGPAPKPTPVPPPTQQQPPQQQQGGSPAQQGTPDQGTPTQQGGDCQDDSLASASDVSSTFSSLLARSTVPTAAGVCDLAALAFADLTFNNQAAAQTECNTLQARTGNGTCVVQRLNNGRFRARLRKLLQVSQQPAATLVQDLVNFISQNNLQADNVIKLQSAFGNGCN